MARLNNFEIGDVDEFFKDLLKGTIPIPRHLRDGISSSWDEFEENKENEGKKGRAHGCVGTCVGEMKIRRNRDKYVSGIEQKEAYEKYCAAKNIPVDIAGFSEWLECDWAKTDDSGHGGFSIGDMVKFDRGRVPYKIGSFHSCGDKVYASVSRKDEEGVNTTYEVPVGELKKVSFKPWDYSTARKHLGLIIENKDKTEAEMICRVKVGKDGKVYVNGRTTTELLNGEWDGEGFACAIVED